jgi:hypothetical protein
MLWGESVDRAEDAFLHVGGRVLRQTGSVGVGTAVCQVYRKNTRTHM